MLNGSEDIKTVSEQLAKQLAAKRNGSSTGPKNHIRVDLDDLYNYRNYYTIAEGQWLIKESNNGKI